MADNGADVMEIIDIHNHILYGVDDGARKLEDSMAIIKEEYENGVRRIIFTPHYQTGVYQAKAEKLSERQIILNPLSIKVLRLRNRAVI